MSALLQVLRLSGGSLALLSPWGEGAGCLALVSASGLAALAPDMPDCPPSTLQFVSAAVRRCLKVGWRTIIVVTIKLNTFPPYCQSIQYTIVHCYISQTIMYIFKF